VALARLPRPRATFVLGVDRPLYLSVHSAVARLAPADGAVIHVMRYRPPGDTMEPRAIEREPEELLDLAPPGWRDVGGGRRFPPLVGGGRGLRRRRRGRRGGTTGACDPGGRGRLRRGRLGRPRGAPRRREPRERTPGGDARARVGARRRRRCRMNLEEHR